MFIFCVAEHDPPRWQAGGSPHHGRICVLECSLLTNKRRSIAVTEGVFHEGDLAIDIGRYIDRGRDLKINQRSGTTATMVQVCRVRYRSGNQGERLCRTSGEYNNGGQGTENGQHKQP